MTRDVDSFEPFEAAPSAASTDLDELLNATQVQAVSAVEWLWLKNWKFGPRSILDSMWFYVEKGSGYYLRANHNERVHFGPGSLVLVPPDTVHTIEQDTNSESHVYAVHFNARIYSAIDLFSLFGFPMVVSSNPDSPYASVSRRLVREFALKPPGWRSAMNAEIFAALVEIIRTEASHFKPDLNLTALVEIPRFLPVFRHIEQNLSRPEYTMLEMARAAYLSEVHFRKVFRRVTGISPLKFLQRRRIERACSLLHTSSDSISSIAEACGFQAQPYFHRIFHAWTGTTPRAYRRGEKP
jgi:AraC-like DNA-binding protein